MLKLFAYLKKVIKFYLLLPYLFISKLGRNWAISRGVEGTIDHSRVATLGYYFFSIWFFSTFVSYLLGIWLFTR
jgi:hypothetical protein